MPAASPGLPSRLAARSCTRNSENASAAECEAQSGEHHKVGVKLDALQSAHAERQKPVVVLEHSELALNSYAVLVEGAEAFSVAGDLRVVPVYKVTEREAIRS